MRTRQRLISLLLVIVSIISLLSPFESSLIDTAYAEGYGDGSGVAKTLGKGNGNGTFSSDRCGVRIYVLTKNGELGSNVVDILFTGYTHWGPTRSASHKFIAMFGTRAKDDASGVIGSESHYVKASARNVELAKIPCSTGDRLVFWDTYSQGNEIFSHVLTQIMGCFPITNPSKGISNGARLKQLMLGTPSAGIWMPTESSAGAGGGADDYDHSIDEIKPEKVGEQLEKSKEALQKTIDLLSKSTANSPEEILTKLVSQAADLVQSLEDREDEAGQKIYSEDEINDVKSALLGMIDDYKAQSGAFGSKDNNSSDKDIGDKDKGNDKSTDKSGKNGLFANISNALFDTAYAANAEEGLEPLYKNGELLNLMDKAGIFKLYPDKLGFTSLAKYKLDDGTEQESNCLTIANAGGVIIMENIFWTRLGNLDKHIVYGTPYNWGRYATENGISESGTKNLGFLTNGSIPKAMYTEKDLELKDGNKVTMTIKAGTNVSGQKRISCSTLASGEYGIGMHYYKFKAPEGGTHTWDKEKFPPGKYTPHPAPDPKEDPPTKPKYPPLEPKTHYRIVKVYEQEQFGADGSKIIQHEVTHTRIPTIPKIQIEDEIEAGYKLIEWKYHKDYYGGPGELENGQDILAEPLPETTPWDSTVIATEPSTRIEKVPKEADKSGTTETTVEIDNKENPQEIVTLYVRLRKKIVIPETSTYDEPDHPPTPGPQPYVDPHPSEEPKNPPNPNVNDPETTEVKKDDPFVHYRIVKCYETCLEKEDGTEEWSTDYIGTTYETNPIVYIQDEGQSPSAGKQDLSWHLEEWQSSLSFRGASGKDTKEMYGNPLSTDWKGLKSEGSPVIKSGTAETKIDLRSNPNGPDDPEDIVTQLSS